MRASTLFSERVFPQRRCIRRGGISIAFVFILLIMVAGLVLLVNRSYGLLIRQHQQQTCDLLALGAIEALLDDELLQDAPVVSAQVNQVGDELAEVDEVILHNTSGLLALNNAVSAPALQVQASEVAVTFGRLDDAKVSPNAEVAPGVPNFSNAANGPLFNTIRVEIYRDAASMRRAFPLIRGIVRDNVYDIRLGSGSFATLDSRVIGFRPIPTSGKNAPLVPIAIQKNAWFNVRPTQGDSNGNGRRELWLQWKNVPADTANAALINLDDALNLVPALWPTQIQNGVTAANLPSSVFGPAHPQQPYLVDATDFSPGNLAAVENALASIIGTNKAWRVFPIYNTYNNLLSLEGFVGAEILAIDTSAPGLRVLVEPAFITHSTVVTSRTVTNGLNQTFPVNENVYIHKIRLTQ